MIELSILLVILAAVVVGAVLGVRWWSWRPVVARRVIVQLASGHALSGVVTARRGPLLVLADVQVHVPGEPAATKADGTAVVERSQVLWMQVT